MSQPTPATAPQTPGEAPHWRLAAIPHLQVGELRVVDVPARPGVAAYKDHLATTACGEEITCTLVTRQADRTRCPHCRVAIDPARQVMTFKAANEFGSPKGGLIAFTRAELAQQVQRWYDAGWRSLEVTAGGEIVAAIAAHPDTDARMWWSETAIDQPDTAAPDTAWPAGKTFGELTPAQRAAATGKAAATLQTELTAAAPAISAALEAADAPLTVVVTITMTPAQQAEYADDFDIPLGEVAKDVADHAYDRVADAFVGNYWVRNYATFTVSDPS